MPGKRRFEGAEQNKQAALGRVTAATRVSEVIDAETVPANALEIMSIEDEQRRSALVKNELEDVTMLTAELVALRERANVEGRIKNLNHVRKLDDFLEGVLDKITKPSMMNKMEEAMEKALEKGDIKQVKELMVAIGIALDKKNAMIEGNGFTDGGKKNVKIAVNFANNGSTQVGVQVN